MRERHVSHGSPAHREPHVSDRAVRLHAQRLARLLPQPQPAAVSDADVHGLLRVRLGVGSAGRGGQARLSALHTRRGARLPRQGVHVLDARALGARRRAAPVQAQAGECQVAGAQAAAEARPSPQRLQGGHEHAAARVLLRGPAHGARPQVERREGAPLSEHRVGGRVRSRLQQPLVRRPHAHGDHSDDRLAARRPQLGHVPDRGDAGQAVRAQEERAHVEALPASGRVPQVPHQHAPLVGQAQLLGRLQHAHAHAQRAPLLLGQPGAAAQQHQAADVPRQGLRGEGDQAGDHGPEERARHVRHTLLVRLVAAAVGRGERVAAQSARAHHHAAQVRPGAGARARAQLLPHRVSRLARHRPHIREVQLGRTGRTRRPGRVHCADRLRLDQRRHPAPHQPLQGRAHQRVRVRPARRRRHHCQSRCSYYHDYQLTGTCCKLLHHHHHRHSS